MNRIILPAMVLLLTITACKSSSSEQEEAAPAREQPTGDSAEPANDVRAPFAGCEMTEFTSGWIEATCETTRFLIQPDRSATATIDQTWPPMSKALSEDFEADVFGEEIDVELNGRAIPARSFTVSKPEETTMVRGIYALWDAGETAKMAAACIQKPADFNREACIRGFAALSRDGIPGGSQVNPASESGAAVVLAGQPLVLQDDCEVTGERKISCESGELTWYQGEPEEARAKIDKALTDMKNVASATGAEVEKTEKPCSVGDYEATCEVHDIVSDAHQARFHSVVVKLDGESLAIACWYDTLQSMPSVCQTLLGADEEATTTDE